MGRDHAVGCGTNSAGARLLRHYPVRNTVSSEVGNSAERNAYDRSDPNKLNFAIVGVQGNRTEIDDCDSVSLRNRVLFFSFIFFSLIQAVVC